MQMNLYLTPSEKGVLKPHVACENEKKQKEKKRLI